MYDSEELQEKLLLSPSAYVVLTATAKLEITLLDPFYNGLEAVTALTAFCVFSGVQKALFSKSHCGQQ